MAFFKAVKDMMVPSFFLLLLLNVGLVVAARPAFRLPFKKTDWRYQAFAGLMRQGFQDAITLARVVVLTGTDCDPVRMPRDQINPSHKYLRVTRTCTGSLWRQC
jgi:hypothetical protein